MNSTSGSVRALLLWRLGFSSHSSPFSVDLRFFVSLYRSKAFCLISSALLLSSFNVLDCVSVINFNKHVLKKRWGVCPGGTHHNGLKREAPPKQGIFFRLQVYEREGILLVEVYERVGTSVIWVCEMASRVTNEFYGFIKSRKRSICVISSILKDTSFKAVKRGAKF